MRILIADDHPIFRAGVKDILKESPHVSRVDEAANSAEVINMAINQKYDVVILDISMPGRSGLEVLTELKRFKPELHVLILSMYSERQYAVQAMRAGASGYLNKNGATRELLTALTEIVAGKQYLSAGVAEQLLSEVRGEHARLPHEQLSPRELQVLRMIGEGKSIKQIAGALAISQSAVSTHRSRILSKMKLSTKADLIRYAIKNHLVE